MKVVFVSNYFNHHQKPFCDEMYEKLCGNFTFISTTVMREERIRLGYLQGQPPDYVLLSYESEKKKKEAISLINEADVVIAGSAPDEMLLQRIRSDKLTLRYSERPFKREKSFVKKIYHAFYFRKRDLFKDNIYMLCAGAYAEKDFSSIGIYKNRTYKWGYFPAVKEYDVDSLFSAKKNNVIMWCGRLIDWKHPDDAVILASKLKKIGYDFSLNIVGNGVMENELKSLVEDAGLSDVVNFMGSMPPEKVRYCMEEAGIFIFTSDRQEGWGAVLNEAMNSGCAVVASDATGAASYLINDGTNGMLYPSTDTDTLFQKVRYLLDNTEKQKALGIAAYHTVKNLWNAKVAAERILQLSERLLKGEKHPVLFETGPCSETN